MKLYAEIFTNAFDFDNAVTSNFDREKYPWINVNHYGPLYLKDVMNHIPPENFISLQTTPDFKGMFTIVLVWKGEKV